MDFVSKIGLSTITHFPIMSAFLTFSGSMEIVLVISIGAIVVIIQKELSNIAAMNTQDKVKFHYPCNKKHGSQTSPSTLST